jgi:hypothetical protein
MPWFSGCIVMHPKSLFIICEYVNSIFKEIRNIFNCWESSNNF